ncbi:PREDICTED: slit homolog 1 protein-like isoform X2 [Acropora digitifera]|uniref:slit homolog 1 protein-like isoform X2 n=1 Tax=Acropora digitifera TaxID=70779 RepID=UPI00077AD93F|nr:PREDICTED: slit homolog 1 protein-like isoform X2 [Acropora digitifera]
MEKRYLYLIVLTLFCLVEEIKGGISCKEESLFFFHTITCTPGHPKEHNVTIKKIEDAMPKYFKKDGARFLQLEGIQLKLSPGCFKAFKNLGALGLAETGIKEVSAEYFEGLNKLSTLTLDYNLLTTLPRNFIDVLKKKNDFIALKLRGNKWDCLCGSGLHRALSDLTDVKILGHGYCHTPSVVQDQPIDNFKCVGHIKKIEDALPKNNENKAVIKDLSLMGIQLKGKLYPGCFKEFKNVETLNLAKTGIKEVSTEYFKGLKKLSSLFLEDNLLTTLPRNFIDVLKKNTGSLTLALHGNKWDCSCGSGLHRALSDLTNVKFIQKAYCETPELARNQPLDNFKCADTDQCMEENDCDDEAVCTNTLQGYNCRCATAGFTGNGKECTDIDECEGENFCAPVGGKCVNEQGKYRCECLKGYEGNGKICKDINECKTHDCGGEGECVNTQGSFRCDCDSGYKRNHQHVCVDIDECDLGNHTCDTLEHGYCFNVKKLLPKDPGYRCVCESGYLKVGSACVKRGSTLELLKYIGVIVGGFLGGLLLIIVGTLWLRRRMQLRLEAQELLEKALMAPVVPMPPPMDFDMPQPEKDQEWEEEDEEG